MAITYPVDVQLTKWAVFKVSTGEIISRNKPWPRADGGPIEGLDPDFVYLLQTQTTQPDYDSRLFQLVGNEVVDIDANTIGIQWTTQDRPTAEKKEYAQNEEAYQFTRHFPVERIALETAFVLGILIQFAVDGQAIPAKWRRYVTGYRDKVKDKLLPNRGHLLAILDQIDAGTEPDLDTGWTDPDA